MFPDDQLNALPPEGISLGLKSLIYFGMLAVILSIVFSKFFVSRGRTVVSSSSNNASAFGLSTSLSSEQDRAVALSAEKLGIEAMLPFLETARDQGIISTSGYVKAKRLLEADLLLINQSLQDLQRKVALPGIQQTTQSASSMDDDVELADLEADLQSKLEEDPFVVPARRNQPTTPPARPQQPKVAEDLPIPQSTRTPSSIPAPQRSMETTSATREIPMPERPAVQPKEIPSPSPPSPSQSTRHVDIPAPTPPRPTQVSATPQPRSTAPKIPKPEPPQKSAAPEMPSATMPTIPKPEQPDDSKFAKSTSIAALRMDMLKELAKLKKYFNETDEQ